MDSIDLDVSVGSEFDGFAVFVVGGAVRDALRGMNPEDIDLMAVPQSGEVDNPVSVLDGRMTMIDPASTIPVFKDSEGREVALPRTEENAGDGHKGFDMSVVSAGTPVDEAVRVDLERRDLTINAMAVNARTGELFDPFGGADDLEAGIIRHVSEAFRDDPLRVVRFPRFTARIDGEVAQETLELGREVARQPVSAKTQLKVIARDIAHHDAEVAESLENVAEAFPDDGSRRTAIEVVERAVADRALDRFDIIARLEREMNQIEALPTERITKEFRKVVRQAEDDAGRFFRVLDDADAFGSAFPVLADADVSVDRFARGVSGAASGGFSAVLVALGGLLGDRAEDFARSQDVTRQEAATLGAAADLIDDVRGFDELPGARAVAVFDRIGGERAAPPEAFVAGAAALADDGFDREAVAARLDEAARVFDEVDGGAVMDAEGLSPSDIGDVVAPDEFGQLVDDHRARRLDG